jgi:LmbE family N-acetylglucosaminyl deacetylase
MDALSAVLGTSLLVLAHPDDECVTYGALLQRMADPTVLFLTDGAPRDPYFWQRYGSREAYASLRQQEARQALARVGVRQVQFVTASRGPQQMPLVRLPGHNGDAAASEVLIDQDLFRVLPAAWRELSGAIERLRPQALLTLAYEGGHPDHDSCNLLVALAARRFGLPAWEAPIYSRARDSESDHPLPQKFIRENGTEIDIRPTPAEIARKREMWQIYRSQGDFLRFFAPEVETVRPLPPYDYSQPPHPGKLNYEHWQWSMTGQEVCAAFSEFLKGFQPAG